MDSGADEKMAALKRAYADIILNTARESAARILLSERKALKCQQSMFAAKEEALSTIMRLKSIMDAKIQEAEKFSMGQQRRIQELEGQLSNAQDTISHLREELRRVNNKSVMNSESPKEVEPADRRSMVHVNLVTEEEKCVQLDDSKVTTSHHDVEETVELSDMRDDVPSKHSDVKEETCKPNGTLAQGGKNKFLKYTFQRTRKRGSSGRNNESSLAAREVVMKRKFGEQQSVVVESRNPSLVTELPRDNRRLVQVARQLISLSERRW
ncbi:uncharacterized protein M6B38_349645 [Iris pallida]|uniref:Uncharacterized protein n=1 Tax=Iris pallida TaxID=29817 RepID=A0AAX6GS63_IRIPA|nr:uncharacterized protein M6B38_349645 [Iris pallida]